MRDRNLAEMMGEKHDVWNGYELIKCDFSTPYWRARLMDFCVEQEWWDSFRFTQERKWREEYWSGLVDKDFTAYLWKHLPDLVVEYRGEHD